MIINTYGWSTKNATSRLNSTGCQYVTQQKLGVRNASTTCLWLVLKCIPLSKSLHVEAKYKLSTRGREINQSKLYEKIKSLATGYIIFEWRQFYKEEKLSNCWLAQVWELNQSTRSSKSNYLMMQLRNKV